MTPIQRAVTLVGGQSALARALEPPPTPQAVQKWCATGKVPVSRVLGIEALTGGRVTRHELRPDIYPDAAAKKAPRKRLATPAPVKIAA